MKSQFVKCWVMTLFILIPTSIFAENFAPEVLHVSAPKVVTYYFDGTDLIIPVQVSGTPATAILSIYTRDRARVIKNVRNGYLGWHYVNNIDTCIYISAPYHLKTGENTIIWKGRDQEGRRLYPKDGYCSYYVWAVSSSPDMKKVTDSINFHHFDRSFVQTIDEQGHPLAQPVIYDAPQSFTSTADRTRKVRGRWTIGSDPGNPSLLETTSYMSFAENSLLALDPQHTNMFFVQSLRNDGTLITDKWKWVPGGESIMQMDWGVDGSCSTSTSLTPETAQYNGPVSNGEDCLLLTEPQPGAGIIYLSVSDGCEIKRLDVRSWWPDEDGLPNGPVNMSYSMGKLFLSSPYSCIMQMLDFYYEYASDSVIWVNGNGDGIGDKNFEPDSPNQWACSDSDRPTFNGTLSADSNLFTVFPADGKDVVSLALLGPDGTGLGYFTLPGMEGGRVYGLHVIDYGSAYDGIYYGGVSADGDSGGVWYSGLASFKGMIWFNGGDSAGPFIWILDPGVGDRLTPGALQPITWWSEEVERVRIQFSADGGSTWVTVADSVNAGAGYAWTVPNISSTNCRIRVTDINNSVTSGIIQGVFTISGSSSVSDQSSTPRPFVAVSNHPNPFNPATTIRYELGMPGRVTLSVYNALGQRVSRHDLGQKERGAHEFVFDGSRLTSGVYFYRVEAGGASATGKMMMVR
jgi:hypothetical protein